MTPMITVAMPVKNGAKFLAEAIESILAQSYEDFELLILDDHSDDDSAKIVKAYESLDPRVKLLLAKGEGLVSALNQLLEVAKGEYFARMDADDISNPARLEKQFQHLEQHADCDIIGSWVSVMGQKQEIWHYRRTFADTATVLLMGKTPLCHPSIMGRKAVMRRLGYRSKYRHMEDMDLFARALAMGVKFYALPEILLQYRIHSASISAQHEAAQMSQRARIVKEMMNSITETTAYDEQIDQFVRSVSYGQRIDDEARDFFKQHMLAINAVLSKLGITASEEWQKKQQWLAGVGIDE
ncbi:glycosyltransferase family 2 protein [Marinomonas gallaica]|uniref:glycosyltransferase family 2 protein n=2 Tax=Oceanospirillaceae TaxID=135620 RepID=UPI003A90F6C1